MYNGSIYIYGDDGIYGRSLEIYDLENGNSDFGTAPDFEITDSCMVTYLVKS